MRQQITEVGRQNSEGPFGLSLFRRLSSIGLTTDLRHPSRSLPRIAIWKL